jgi:hypothetical protein
LFQATTYNRHSNLAKSVWVGLDEDDASWLFHEILDSPSDANFIALSHSDSVTYFIDDKLRQCIEKEAVAGEADKTEIGAKTQTWPPGRKEPSQVSHILHEIIQ